MLRKKELLRLIEGIKPSNKEDQQRLDLLNDFMAQAGITVVNPNFKIPAVYIMNYFVSRLSSKEKVIELFPLNYLVSDNPTAKLFNKIGMTEFESFPLELQAAVFEQLPSVKFKNSLTRLTHLLHNLFQPKLNKEQFLHHVKEASYAKVAAIARENPSWIFEPLGDEKISPLFYAFKFYDKYMWQLFETIIKEKCQTKWKI